MLKLPKNSFKIDHIHIDVPVQTNAANASDTSRFSERSDGNVKHGNNPKDTGTPHAPSECDFGIGDTYEAGFFTQLTATLRRQVIQKSRMPCSLLLEFILPILLISVLVLTSLSTNDETYPSEQFVESPSDTQLLDPMANFVSEHMCYNSSIPGYQTPQDVKDLISVCEADIGLICAPDDQLPKGIRGICVRNQGYGLFGITAERKEVRVPSFDYMVLVQWAVRALFGGGPTEGLVITSPFFSLRMNGILYFYPNNEAVKSLVNKMESSHKLFKYVYGGTHGSRDEIINKIKYSKEGNTWGIVGMESTNRADLVIELSLNRSALPYTSRVRPVIPTGGEGESKYTYYYTSGFLTLQKALLEKYYSEIEALGAKASGPTVTMVPMGYPKWESNTFLSVVGFVAPLVMVLAFLYTVSQLSKRLVEEKELRLREGTHVMGLSKSAFFSSWLIIYYVEVFVISLAITIILKMSIISQSDVTLMFVLFFAFSISVINMAAVFSTFFNSSNIAAMVVPLMYFMLSIPSFALPAGTPETVFVALGVFFSPISFSVGIGHLFGYEMNNGASWVDAVSSVARPFNIMTAIALLLLNIITYLLLMIYLDNIIPKEWGTTQHPCFCFCFCCRSNKNKKDVDYANDTHICDGPRTKNGASRDSIQDYPGPSSESTLQIRRLKKEFPGSGGQKVKVAVNDLDLKLFPNSITVFLGHNGAGKTTVMNMITGMTDMTHGDITVYGKSVREDLAGVRRSIGYCPQHNILWDDLTCMEHLQYFARLKGVPAKMVDSEAQRMLREVDLEDKSGTRSKALSGGQKRKLSVAIAFVGNSKLILLDEPTAGMDVGARRHTWELLKNMSTVGNRTVLLTTHFMDEADLLGSRIAIMSQGALHSYGTPMYLKNKLGTGYVLKLSSSIPISDPSSLLAKIQEYIPEASIKEIKGQELSVALPKITNKQFPEVIRVMESDEMAQKYNITSISMSVSTLEDVFLKIGYDEEMMAELTESITSDQELQSLSDNGNVDVTLIPHDPNNCFSVLQQVYIDQQKRVNDAPRLSSFGSFTRQFSGLFLKRFHYARRDVRAIIIQIILPALCILFGIGIARVGPPDQKKLDIGMAQWGGVPQMIALNNCSDLNGFFTGFKEVVKKDYNSSLAFSDYLVDTAYEHGQAERSVAVFCGNDGTTGSDTILTSGAVVFQNSTMLHSAPFALLQYYTALARKSMNDKLVNIRMYSHTLPLTERQQNSVASVASIIVAIFVLIPLTFIPSTYVGYIVKERACKAKHLQFVSGAQFFPYWMSNFLFDFMSFIVTTIIVLIIFGGYGQKELIGDITTIGATTSLLLLYGVSGISSAYLVSFLFKDHSTGQNMVLLLNFMCGFILVITYSVLTMLSSTKEVAKKLVFGFRVVPAFCVGEGIMTLSTYASMKKFTGDLSDIFSTEFIGWPLIYMAIMFVVSMTLVLIIDYPKLQGLIAKYYVKKGSSDNANSQQNHQHTEQQSTVILLGDNGAEDEDVAIERDIIENNRRPEDVVVVKQLKKKFGKTVAVNGISFGVKKGEIFGFLGTNGAGKSTTMSMLTGELLPTAGSATVCKFNVLSELKECQKVIGYCPQFDAIIDKLTPDEHLNMYASLRLIPAGEETKRLVDVMIECCDLKQYRGIPAGKLSGGNKRKLSVAISLIGGPLVVFLDEPSAGMDPGARRKLWDVIILVAKQASVVLTTHHLEEVDVLAHRVGIMDHGKMKCLGPLERLKNKFGEGFELNIQVHDEAACTAFMKATFPEAIITENINGRMIFTIPFTSVKLSELFKSIQEACDGNKAGITDYTVQQTSLERVFLRIQAASTENEQLK